MGTTKVQTEATDKAPAAPVVAKQPETPEKQGGPMQVARAATASSLPPPNGAPSPVRGAGMLAEGSRGAGAGSRAQMMTTLQRSVGNTRVSSLIGRAIQTKLSVGAVDDPQEREADRVAETVTQQGSKPKPEAQRIVMKHSLTQLAQRQTRREDEREREETRGQVFRSPVESSEPASDNEEEKHPDHSITEPAAEVSMKSKDEREEPAMPGEEMVQRAASGKEGTADANMEGRIKSPSGGQSLPEDVQREMETGLGADFSGVRVHNSTADMADAEHLGAKAFTHGSDIWLGAGESASDRKLMAHELTHVVQQHSGQTDLNRKSTIAHASEEPRSNKLSPPRREAPRVKAKTIAGRAAPLSSSAVAEAVIGDRANAMAPPAAAGVVSPVQPGSPPLPETVEVDHDRVGSAEAPPGRTKVGPTESEAASEGDVAAPADSPPEVIEAIAESSSETASQKQEAEVASEEATAGVKGQAKAEEAIAVAEAETVAADMEAAPMPSLASLIKPAPEEASQGPPQGSIASATSGPGVTNNVATSAPSTGAVNLSPVSSAKISRQQKETPLVVARQEDENEDDVNAGNEGDEGGPAGDLANDPIAARAAVQHLIGVLSAASSDSQGRIQTQAEATKSALTESAETLRQQVQTHVAATVASLRASFASERAALQVSVADARSQVAAALLTRSAEAASQGEQAKTSLADLFTQQRANVTATVEASVLEVEGMRTRANARASQRTREQATEARHRGDRKSASYPATDRGFVQGEAVEGVAYRTSQEIQDGLPETIEAIDEIVADIPDDFREKGDEALEGIDEGLPDLLARVDEQVQAVTVALASQAGQANQQLDAFETQVMLQLESAETAAVAQAEAIGPQSDVQIEAGLETAFSQVDVSALQAEDQIQQIIDQAIEILTEIESPNVEGATEMADQILQFVSGSTDDTIQAQQEAGENIVEEFGRIDEAAVEGLQSVEQQTSDQLPALSDAVNSSLEDLGLRLDEGFGETLAGMSEAFAETETQVQDQLDQSIDQLAADFAQTLQEADVEVTTAVDEGLAKNDEALGELDPQMEEAADDAAWDYDHPILSTLANIGAIVLGVIAGILLVIALVVVVIVAFKVIVAGLVILGVSAAIAKVIVVVAGLAILAYGIYSAYQARIAAGEEGGWGTFGGALLDISGITDIRRSFTEEGLSPFERGFAFGRGIATLATFFLGRRLNARINSRLPRSITNPTRGSAWRWLRGRFGRGGRRPPSRGQTKAPARGCFLAGTKVLTANASKQIEDLVIGDEVYTGDPESGRQSCQRVDQTFIHTVPVLLNIRIGSTIISCTPEHPFWVPGDGWQEASLLKSGCSLLTLDGVIVKVDSVESLAGTFTVYNIEVEGLNTYNVSSLGVLVHNKAMRAGPIIEKSGNGYIARDPGTGDVVGVGELRNGYIEFVIQTKGSGTRGGDVFNGIYDAFILDGKTVRGVRGLWYAQDNLASFNNAIRAGMTPEQAALETFTGKMAVRAGHGKVTIDYSKSPQNPDGTFKKAELWFD